MNNLGQDPGQPTQRICAGERLAPSQPFPGAAAGRPFSKPQGYTVGEGTSPTYREAKSTEPSQATVSPAWPISFLGPAGLVQQVCLRAARASRVGAGGCHLASTLPFPPRLARRRRPIAAGRTCPGWRPRRAAPAWMRRAPERAGRARGRRGSQGLRPDHWQPRGDA